MPNMDRECEAAAEESLRQLRLTDSPQHSYKFPRRVHSTASSAAGSATGSVTGSPCRQNASFEVGPEMMPYSPYHHVLSPEAMAVYGPPTSPYHQTSSEFFVRERDITHQEHHAYDNPGSVVGTPTMQRTPSRMSGNMGHRRNLSNVSNASSGSVVNLSFCLEDDEYPAHPYYRQ